MLGLGWTEMLVIGVMALIFIGPKDLPVVMDRIGKVAGQVRRMGADFQREINKTTGLDEVRNLRNSITGPLKKTSDEIRKEFNAMTPNGAKPSGVIKPADPAAESVVDEIRAKAGMTAPAASLSADEAAKAAGFKPAGPAASTATFGKPSGATAGKAPGRKAPARAKAAPTGPVTRSDLAPVDAPVLAAENSTSKALMAKTTAAAKPARKSSPTKTATAKTAAPPVPKVASAAQPSEVATARPVAAKRLRTKPKSVATTAGKAEDK